MRCKDCNQKKPLTRHSKIGGHQPPFKPRKSPKQNKKIQGGTFDGKYKKK